MNFIQAVAAARRVPTGSVIPISTDQLVLFYDASIISSYPGTGNTVYDISPTGNNGTMNGATFTTLGGVKTFYFDGIKDDITTQSNTTEVSFSASLWIRHIRTTIGTTQEPIISKWYTSKLSWITDAYNGLHRFATRQGLSTPIVSTSATTAQWVYMVYTYQTGGAAKIYRNGVQVASGTLSSSLQFATNKIQIGRKGDNATARFYGYMSQIAVHHKSLTSAEVLSNFNATKSYFGL